MVLLCELRFRPSSHGDGNFYVFYLEMVNFNLKKKLFEQNRNRILYLHMICFLSDTHLGHTYISISAAKRWLMLTHL